MYTNESYIETVKDEASFLEKSGKDDGKFHFPFKLFDYYSGKASFYMLGLFFLWILVLLKRLLI